MRCPIIATAAVLAGLAAMPAAAGENGGGHSSGCTGVNSGLPPALAGWAKAPVPMTTAHDSAEAAHLFFPSGARVAFALARTDTIRFAHPPGEQMPKQYVYSGMASFHVPKDGEYTVMISEANWVDVIAQGRLLQPLEMRGRLPCVKYGKKLVFALKAGDVTIQFFGAPYDSVDVMAAPSP